MRNHRRVLLAFACASLLLATLTGAVRAGQAGSKAKSSLQMYEATVTGAQLEQLEAAGYDVVSIDPLADELLAIELVAYPSDRKAIEKLGIDLTIWHNDDGLTATQLAAQQQESGYKVWRDYDSPNTGINAYTQQIASQNSFVKRVVLGTTFEGREIVALKVTKDADTIADGTRPAVLYSSLQHAREWISVEVNRRLLEWFVKKYKSGDTAIKNLLSTTELWFVLVANPDGYQFTFDGDRLWRKNTHEFNGVDGTQTGDGVDPNRNFPEHWNYDDEGSSGQTSSETYRGESAGSEEETKAMERLYDIVDGSNDSGFVFQVNYHSFGELLLYSFGYQVNTPSEDDPVFVALSGTDKHPAIQGFDPGVGADLYTTNGETTDWAHGGNGALAWTPELGEGPNGDGFIFPDKEGEIEAEFKRNLPFALDVAKSALDPDDPQSQAGIDTQPFYLDVSEIDPQKAHNPLSDFSFEFSYGDPQPVEVLAKRALGPVTANWRINGTGPVHSGSTTEWEGGDVFGSDLGDGHAGDEYYRIMRGEVTGTSPGDSVEVWFTGGGQRSPSFTYRAISETGADVLVLAAEDYSGASSDPTYPAGSGPRYLSYFTDALDANGVTYDVYDVDAMGRTAPDNTGVLSHYDAVIWYTANDFLTREPGQQPGTGASTLANSEMLEVRSYLNEGGRLLYNGQWAGYEFANAFPYNAVSTPPFCDGTVPNKTGLECLLLSDDFLQYWLGAYIYNDDAGTGPNGPYPVDGTEAPYDGTDWTLNGGDSADNQVHTASFITTSSLLDESTYPQFTSRAPAAWDTGQGGAFEPHSGAHYVYSNRADISYKRFGRTIDLSSLASGAPASLSFYTSYDTEPNWDFVFVEAHTVGQDDWVTLPDANGHTSSSVGDSCPEGWFELHPFLERYQGADCSGAGWNAASGRSEGWENWEVDLSQFSGSEVEVAISYASDWATQGLGAWVDDATISTEGTEDFEAGTGAWDTLPVPEGSDENPNNWEWTTSVGYHEGAVVTMDPPTAAFRTLYFGFGFEGVTTEAERNDVMGRALDYLLG